MEILNKSKKMCPCCMEEHEVLVVLVQEKTVFKGVEVTYNATYEYCERCDEYNATEEMITANDIAIKNAYRNKMGLLTSDKIIAIRKKYAISQSDLCTLLAWGKKTITRYEGHQVQDAAHDKILRKLDSDPEWFLSLLEKAKNAFSEAAYEKYYQNALKLFKASKDLYLQKAVGAHYACSEESEVYEYNEKLTLLKRESVCLVNEKSKANNIIKANKKNTKKSIATKVTEDMLAVHVGSGTLSVLGTPVLAMLYENAAMQLAAEYCEPGTTTVGCALSLSHDAPTPLGMEFTVTVTLVKQEKRVFEFMLEASDECGVISKGTHTRVAVSSEKFQQKADAKQRFRTATQF